MYEQKMRGQWAEQYKYVSREDFSYVIV